MLGHHGHVCGRASRARAGEHAAVGAGGASVGVALMRSCAAFAAQAACDIDRGSVR